MARPLPVSKITAPAKPDVLNEVLRTMVRLDRRVLTLGKAVLQMHASVAEILTWVREQKGDSRTVDPLAATIAVMPPESNGNGADHA